MLDSLTAWNLRLLLLAYLHCPALPPLSSLAPSAIGFCLATPNHFGDPVPEILLSFLFSYHSPSPSSPGVIPFAPDHITPTHPPPRSFTQYERPQAPEVRPSQYSREIFNADICVVLFRRFPQLDQGEIFSLQDAFRRLDVDDRGYLDEASAIKATQQSERQPYDVVRQALKGVELDSSRRVELEDYIDVSGHCFDFFI